MRRWEWLFCFMAFLSGCLHRRPVFPPGGRGWASRGVFLYESAVFTGVLRDVFFNSHAVTPLGGPLLVVLCTVVQMRALSV